MFPNFIENNYNPANWYWNVAEVANGTVYSSAVEGFVSNTDANYVAWSNTTGNFTTNIDTKANLAEVLNNAGVPQTLVPPTIISTAEFYGRFTPEEQMMLANLAINNAQMHVWEIQVLTTTPNINLANAVLITGVQAVVADGLLDPTRANVIIYPSTI